eukprot:CAMPEP_0175134468 /NCGR_PEP_ID=MMETSP0087-20121206/8196_1 /TAXON_ID=136419 /ORGANISM="Unknown Unknown, Strain D1" /LENGTH=444 /DNA_ID=CAMNT_0016417035 /DNA_START=344 /DNA_END=1678 /DNA_ORIENTATION=+
MKLRGLSMDYDNEGPMFFTSPQILPSPGMLPASGADKSRFPTQFSLNSYVPSSKSTSTSILANLRETNTAESSPIKGDGPNNTMGYYNDAGAEQASATSAKIGEKRFRSDSVGDLWGTPHLNLTQFTPPTQPQHTPSSPPAHPLQPAQPNNNAEDSGEGDSDEGDSDSDSDSDSSSDDHDPGPIVGSSEFVFAVPVSVNKAVTDASFRKRFDIDPVVAGLPPGAVPPTGISISPGSSCHQCKSRREADQLYFCKFNPSTAATPPKHKKVSCRKKYCKTCLHKFYSEAVADPGKWICPSCRHCCCCAACRRNHGNIQALPPKNKAPMPEMAKPQNHLPPTATLPNFQKAIKSTSNNHPMIKEKKMRKIPSMKSSRPLSPATCLAQALVQCPDILHSSMTPDSCIVSSFSAPGPPLANPFSPIPDQYRFTSQRSYDPYGYDKYSQF